MFSGVCRLNGSELSNLKVLEKIVVWLVTVKKFAESFGTAHRPQRLC
jgi:hypothetical protein